jgi:hypothetical protein
MKDMKRSSETSVLTRATRRNVPKDGILGSYRRENLKSYEFGILKDVVHIVTTVLERVITASGSVLSWTAAHN